MALMGISIGLALLISVLAWRAASAQTSDVEKSAWNAEDLETVMATFAALTEPAENAYLRESLTRRDYLRCRRARALSARKCLKHIGNSASWVLQLEIAEDCEENRAALRQLTQAAASVRLVASVASAYLFLVWLFPNWMFSLPLRLARYREFLQQVRAFHADAQQVF